MKHSRTSLLLRPLACSGVIGSLSFGSVAFAQEPPAAEPPPEGAPAERTDGDARAADDEMRARVDDHGEAHPAPPERLGDDEGLDGPHRVVAGAGMGSDVSYARRGVVELGGLLSLDVRDELFDLTIAPTIGYFVIDRLQLSLIPLLRIRSLDDDGDGVSETNVRFAGLLEPSYHFPLCELVFGFVGLGLGITAEEGPGVDFLMRPVAGLDVLVGRSGILKPAGFVDVGVGDGAIGGGAQAAFTVMF